VHYKNLIKEPSVQLKKVCNFLNIEFIEPNYNNIEQFNINEIKYDDSVLSSNFHTINTNGIQDKKTIVEDILPESIINKYKNFDVRF